MRNNSVEAKRSIIPIRYEFILKFPSDIFVHFFFRNEHSNWFLILWKKKIFARVS